MKTLITLLVLMVTAVVGAVAAADSAQADDLRIIRVVAKTLPLFADAEASSEKARFPRDQVVLPSGGLAVDAVNEPLMMLKITVNGQTGWVEAHRVETNRPPTVAVVCDKRALPQAGAAARNAGERGTCAQRR